MIKLPMEECFEFCRENEGLFFNGYGCENYELDIWDEPGTRLLYKEGTLCYKYKHENVTKADKEFLDNALEFKKGDWTIWNVKMVNDTKLARKMYPNAKEYEGKLIVEDENE
jgi:hypothetical protein